MSMMKKKSTHTPALRGGGGGGGGGWGGGGWGWVGGVREGGRITSLFAVFCVFKCP